MFSEIDREEYFRLIEIKEHAILHFLTDTISQLHEESIIAELKGLLQEEVQQYGVSQKLLSLVKELPPK
jgi:hypothetical protein